MRVVDIYSSNLIHEVRGQRLRESERIPRDMPGARQPRYLSRVGGELPKCSQVRTENKARTIRHDLHHMALREVYGMHVNRRCTH